MIDDLLTIEEAALKMQVSVRTVRTYLSDGLLVAVKKREGKRKFLRSREIDAFMQMRSEGGIRRLLATKVQQLQTRVTELEERMSVVLQILAEPESLEARVGRVLKRVK